MAKKFTLFVALISSQHIKEIDFIAEEFKKLDCKITRILTTTGVIEGSTYDLPSLMKKSIKGVEVIEEQKKVNTK